ncbi:TIGR03086 family metal-binding protein [Arachnia propionica]|uniref:TIGR03086 family protein n=1 Tax=Arachnia propionica TaxID=1750 RepID=A0A3P1WSF1_9ACTN|nr:TIGR03086 family metal-binding protein [Arachnia propionica]RRD48697.1 TIGR03086 family protein [Arachnia propionica]
MTDTLERLPQVLDALAAVAASITPDQLTGPTPCADFDVAALLGHVVGWLESFATGYASPDGVAPAGDAAEVRVQPDEAAARIRRASATLLEAVRGGAAERPLVVGGVGMPGEMALALILGEYLAHGWDLAVATGQSWTPDDEALRRSREFLQTMVTPESRGGDWFGPEVPVAAEAPQLDRFLGFTGRDPGWRRH